MAETGLDADVEPGDEPDDPGYVAPEPKSAAPWLALITQAEKTFSPYQDRADSIDKLYGNLERLSNGVRDREFQMFWANVQVIGPSIYSRPPIPVVVPRFKDRSPLKRLTSELLERCVTVAIETYDIDGVMRAVRDDLTIVARGPVWLRYETKKDSETDYERICVEHIDRKDFLHDPSREWAEASWVARRAWMSRKELRKRFYKSSANEYQKATLEITSDAKEGDDGKRKAGVWELWHKTENKVIWVAPGCEKLLDEGAPHLSLRDYFPSPKPAFGTLQRRTMLPIPDMVFYKDQLEEINQLTARIAALTESLKLRGFYPAGAGEVGDAIEAAIKSTSDNQVIVGISNWALLGNGNAKDLILWLPLDMVAKTIQQLVEERRVIIEDIYQIMGLSDIMRGSTNASETLGAQQLKSQYGSIRIRDKQDELVRVARDIIRITAEIIAENFSAKTLLAMSQMDIPSRADIQKQIKEATQAHEADVQQAMADPELVAKAQAQPDVAQQVLAQGQQQLAAKVAEIEKTVTIEDVMELLRDEGVRSFTLDIETDSTIAPDENAQKQRATEFITAVGGFLSQAVPLVAEAPEIAPMAGTMLEFVSSQFRVGRSVQTEIDEFVDKMKERAGQPKPPSAEQIKAEAEAKAHQATEAAQAAAAQDSQDAMQVRQQQAQQDEARKTELHQIEIEGTTAATQRAAQLDQQKQDALAQDRANKDQKHSQDMELGSLDLQQRKLAVAQAAVSLATTATEPAAKPAGANGEGGMEEGAEPAEDPDAKMERISAILGSIKFDSGNADANSAAIMQGLEHVAQLVVGQGEAHGAKLDLLTKATLAPVEIIRGPDGKALGSQKVLQ